jgi:phosphoglycolate phosphatase-like HAD superfamily hydrolase
LKYRGFEVLSESLNSSDAFRALASVLASFNSEPLAENARELQQVRPYRTARDIWVSMVTENARELQQARPYTDRRRVLIERRRPALSRAAQSLTDIPYSGVQPLLHHTQILRLRIIIYTDTDVSRPGRQPASLILLSGPVLVQPAGPPFSLSDISREYFHHS